MTDSELLARYARNRDQDALRDLLERHAGLIYASALRQVRDPGMAQDVTQGVFLVLAAKASSLPGRAVNLPAWLLVVTRYAAANALKSRNVRARHEKEAALMQTASASNVDPEILSSVLDNALNQLSPDDRTAIALYYLENRSLRDVGNALAISESAAQMRVSRALARLRKILSHLGINSPAEAIEASLHRCGTIIAPPAILTALINGVVHPAGASSANAASTAIAHKALKNLRMKTVKTFALTAAITAGAVVAVAAPTVPLIYHMFAATLMNSSPISVPAANSTSNNLPATSAPAATSYTVIDLTDLAPYGSKQSFADGISDHQAVGWACDNDNIYIGGNIKSGIKAQLHAMLWTGIAGGVVDLNPAGFVYSYVSTTNGIQQGGFGCRMNSNSVHAILWSGSPNNYVDLNPAGFRDSDIIDMSANQQVGVGKIDNTFHALLWTGTPESAVDLNPDGFVKSYAEAIWGTHQVGYGTTVQGGHLHALLWTGTAASCIDLNPDGGTTSQAYGICGNQEVGYGVFSTFGIETMHAMLWTGTAASHIDLNPLGFADSVASATNGIQQVGGGLPIGSKNSHALAWNSSAKNFVDLQQFLPSNLASFDNSWAQSINAKGDIVGNAWDSSGKNRAIEWIPQPPNP